MQILPAIDIRDGKCVRLLKGEYSAQTTYNNDPVAQAKQFEEQGAEYLHVVDLDGALEGNPKNFELIRTIVESVSCKVEVSGGNRGMEHVEKYLSINPWQVILGSVAVFNLPFVEEVLTRYGSDIFSISLDSKDGYAASRGWVDKSEIKIEDLAVQMDKLGIKRYIFTDISRDGMLQGANIEQTVALKKLVSGQVIASGGVSGIEDVQKIAAAGLDGVVIGKAIYEGKIDLKEALAVGRTTVVTK